MFHDSTSALVPLFTVVVVVVGSLAELFVQR